ncbi:Asp-tRNA(Asn)/Glu-tRNA(Gln) amidotransferase GatCAB subunit C [Thermus scotoductus]|uniref:Aspartyl/glutamyl-tRNA(Asn/Gln) amidotransferase subunit C n=2 Tax=Thermaceae TaxID=188786 RepID=A0A0N0ZPE8_THESC|nr:aspartyl/glutamyl-tRNA amidotransferase subunit C [Thermus sp. NMX2.A1]KPD32562.1 glutamyl-tRNA amidotransferase [Thermus scotoductus]RTG94923.1 Asp-tRNA(Asn)/Glu-tRNA(Gln) amidotransferase GatCAB subunit C [Thermus scotoductus]RTG97413.1 Asp-tRNA(Asn)/Glu-tRNA(Gln) amidotransferase GatCAB subunit C [Thermus scotoductus]RTG98203.1 Asp-tRNA(Asn)/Glu-tRNA(Gln) amidotransferase GatCAB subunit C [Thermus scotoductus]
MRGMELSPELLRKLESLAKIRLSPEEEALLLSDLKRILEFVDALPQVGEAWEEEAQGRLREDEPLPSLSQEEALRVAPEAEEGFFRVPKVLE